MSDNTNTKIGSHKFIVFSDEHYNPLGVVRSLGESGISPILIVLDKKLKITSKSKYLYCVHTVDSVEEGYKLLLNKYGRESSPPFVYTCDDRITSFLDTHYDEIKDKFIFFNAGKTGRITQFMDKDNINDLARRHGLNVAKTWKVRKGEIPDSIEFPIITKAISSNSGGCKDDVFICRSKDELEEAYKKIKSEVVLLQKYIEKKNELCLDGFCVDRGKNVFISMGSSYEYILPDKYSSYIFFYKFDNRDILDKIKNMMSEVGFEGIFSIEFLIGQDDELYFLEINFRNSTWSYASTCWKMNLPVMWAEGMTNPKNEFSQKEIPKDAKAIVEISDFKTRVIGQKMNPFKWFSECRKCQCLFYYNSNDLKPFWSALFGKVTHHKK